MPYEWDIDPGKAPAKSGASCSYRDGDAPLARLHLWPYRSLPRRGFVWIIAMAFGLLLLPLMSVVGSVVLWGMLPFTMGALWLLWFFIEKSYRDGEILEELTLWHDRITLTRTGPHARFHEWDANPYWVSLHLHRSGGPVPEYLTLKGAEREVELGAFLSEDERPQLYREVQAALDLARAPTGGRSARG